MGITTSEAALDPTTPGATENTPAGEVLNGDAPAPPAKEPVKKLQPGSPEYLDEVFMYHPPSPDQIPKYQAVREAAKLFAEVIVANCPPSADRSDALRKIRETAMTANSAIALNGRA